jgi:hypothetical protein
MNKDVIYIDVDDDVTAVIGKIKKAKEKIVALVPPKRAGSLQSAVNLRLIDRMARADKKQLVLITNNQALIALAASAKIPVAKNLQTKPEVAEVAALVVDDGDDIIDGSQLPVGDHAKSAKDKGAATVASSMRSDDIDAIDLDIDGESVSGPVAAATVAKSGMAKNAKNAKKTKIPNFDTFRKKLILIAGGGVALIALLVWMFVFAPGATVVITASTTPAPVSSTITLGGTAATNFEEGVVSSASQQIQKEEAVEFEATGEKDVGDKASGTMRLTRTSVSNQPLTVPAGTQFTSSGVVFISSQAATLAGTSVGPGGIVQDSATVTVEASESGTGSNVSARAYSSSVSGINARGSAMAGGTSKVAKVVSADDVERAQGQLVGASTDASKDELKKRFTNGELVIDSSFTVDRGAIVSTPAVGAEASSGKAKLAVPTTYTIQAVSKNDLDTYLRKSLESNLDNKDSEKVYSTGVDEATVGNFRKDGETLLASVTSNGSVGPVINEDSIKEQVKGKRYGEVQQSLESINGIKSVDVQFSYFWVRTVPNNTDKISIQFKVQDE